MTYVVSFHQSCYQSNPWPDPPGDDNRARTLDDVRAMFDRLARAVGVDGTPTDQGGPFAVVYREQDWDGISYGEWPAYRVTVTARGAVRVEAWA